MHRYEILLLTVPEITEDEVRSLESGIDRLIKEEKGTTLSFEKWGKYRLSYPVRKNDYGVYFLARLEIDEPESLLENINSLMKIKLSNLVMRHMVSVLSPKKSLAYQRPPSLEETPSRDVDSFLKEHKMDGLLSSVKPKKFSKAYNEERPNGEASDEIGENEAAGHVEETEMKQSDSDKE